jgi:hypothetical protein
MVAPGPPAPRAAGTYALTSLDGRSLPLAHRKEWCASTGQSLGPGMPFDTVTSGSLRLEPERARLLLGSPTDAPTYRFTVVWRVRTVAPEAGQPAEWDCFQGTGWWWEEPRGTIHLYYQFCAIVACDPAKREAIVASSADFRPGTSLRSTLFNGGVTGTFIKR